MEGIRNGHGCIMERGKIGEVSLRVGGCVKRDTFHFVVLISDETNFVVAFRRAD